MNVPGLVVHPHTLAQLDQVLADSPHALVLAGGSGLGKTLLARALAQQLLAVDTLENQPYYQEVQEQKNSITIAQIRQLNSFFRLQVPGTARVKRVAVLADADHMTSEAQNALLKLLEEPPLGSVLILTSSRTQALLPTVRSRLHTVAVSSPPDELIVQHFIASGYDASQVRSALVRAGGTVAEVQRLLASDSTADDTVATVKQVLGGTSYQRLLLVDSLAKQKDMALQFVDTLAQVAVASIETAAAKNAGSIARWRTILAAAYSARESLERSGNTKLVLTELMLAL